jgi:UDP-2,3-diacylglucosamine pyrophosphatase LpxH
MVPVPSFEQVSVISDLHMGGEEGFQIFGQGPLLVSYLDHLRKDSPEKSALVINGDLVDFLAEPGAKAFEPLKAIDKLDRIFADKQFKPVWDALRKYLRVRHLAITLGNHDIELALPWVREHLIQLLVDGDDASRSRLTLAFDGSGYACTVGTTNVMCVHGNEVDTWNVTDYERLRRISCDLAQGRAVADWTPNAGSMLVAEVMNDIKRRYAFIDLLKPEREGAVRLLLVLNPDQRAKLRAVADVASRRVWDGVRRRIGWLSADEDLESGFEPDSLALIVGAGEMKIDPEKLLDRAELLFRNTNAIDLVYGQQNQQLGWWDALAAVVTRREPHEIAYEAIKEIASDTTFGVAQFASDDTKIDESVGHTYEVVVAGHTHLARAGNRSKARGHYLNSGTWASLMRLTPQQLQTATTFKPIFSQLKQARTIADLGALVWKRPTAVTIRQNGSGVTTSLDEVTLKNQKIVYSSLGPLS